MVNMGIESWSVVGVVMLCFFGFTNSYFIGSDYDLRSDPNVAYKYDRIDEVKKECKDILSSASNLSPNDDRVYSIKNELSFVNGDWGQAVGKAPLMPFEDQVNLMSSTEFDQQLVLKNRSYFRLKPVKLASFWVTDVDRSHRGKNFVSLSGILYMGITVDGSFNQKPYEGSPNFHSWSGHSGLTVLFQGIYTESKVNGGERILCLLGNAMLPSKQHDSSDRSEGNKGSGSSDTQYHPLLLQDDQIMLVLTYPQTLSLTNIAIEGGMKSLNPKNNPKYFDTVHFSSQMSASTNYKFVSERIVSKACDSYPYEDGMLKNGIDIYGDSQFCSMIEQHTRGEVLTIVPNWKCNGTDEYCSKLGPFMLDKFVKATDGGFEGVKLIMQNVRCEQTTLKDGVTTAKVFAVLRAVSSFENLYSAGQRSGLNNMTLLAEGMWRSSSGQLCMVGCLGIVDLEGKGCDSRVCLYIPLSFSIKQRSIVVGSLSSLNKSSRPYFPLSFEKLVRPNELWELFQISNLQYKYSKIELAGSILEKNEPFTFGTIIKKSLLKFPNLENSEVYMSSLSSLSEELSLHTSAMPDPNPKAWSSKTDLQMEILSVGPLFGRKWGYQNGSTIEEEIPYRTKDEYTEKQILLNVSAQLSLGGKDYCNFSVLFLEGLYDPHVGKMYLIGCRDVRASWKVLSESMDLESGLDCSIEVIVSYPPSTTRWLVNPTARISISSQRNDDDPLHFSQIKLQTLPIFYRRQREDILSRSGVEGILRIVTLSIAITCILSQLFYIRENLDSVQYISLVMLGVQALAYSFPLVTGAESIFHRMSSSSYDNQSYYLQNSQWIRVIDYTVKFLVLISCLLTLRLCQKVWKSRVRLLTRTPLEQHRVPSDKWVVLVAFGIHLIGFLIVLIIHTSKTSQRPVLTGTYVVSVSDGSSHTHWEWEVQLEEYLGLVEDFFLLPQIIGNFLWQLDRKPLRKLYFMGITVVRLFPHVYDYMMDPIPNPYFSENYEFVNPSLDFYSKFGDIFIPLTAIFLAIIVYIQQRWNYEKLSQILTLGQYKLLPHVSRAYQRLPSKTFEAELSGVEEYARHKNGLNDED